MKNFIFLIGCNKNQKVANNLEGSWQATNYVYTDDFGSFDHIEDGIFDMTLSFTDCKLKRESGCELRWIKTYNFDGSTYDDSYIYTIMADGDSMFLNSEEDPDLDLEIVAFDKEKLEIKTGNPEEVQREWVFIKK